jgi:CMP-N-acetylneuraminic acid synthetase
MYKRNRILCVIPARSGSKGLPGKNIKSLCGKPLIAYTIEQAKKSKYIDRIIVSTDSKQIASIARRCGAHVPFLRPKRLATDASGTLDVLIHAMDWMEDNSNFDFNILLLLHVTTPLRTPEDIDTCLKTLINDKSCGNIFSVTESHKNPYFNMVEVDNRGRVRLIKKGNYVARQHAPQVYDVNCAIYAWRKGVLRREKGIYLKQTRIFYMPKERSVDIDDELDFKICEMLLRSKSKETQK